MTSVVSVSLFGHHLVALPWPPDPWPPPCSPAAIAPVETDMASATAIVRTDLYIEDVFSYDAWPISPYFEC